MTKQRQLSKQRGGTVLGVVVGLIVGLAIAVVVALYINRSPSPFVAKTAPQGNGVPGATDPNRVLQGKSPVPAPVNTAPGQSAGTAPSGTNPTEPQIIEVPPGGNVSPPQAPAQESIPGILPRLPGAPERAPAADNGIQRPRPASAASAAAPARPREASAAIAPRPGSAPAPAHADANTGYMLQVGAYKTRTDAEQQRARLALQGFEAKITERDNGGITYYRVRVGPFARLEDVNAVKQRLTDAGVETAIIRFQKQ